MPGLEAACNGIGLNDAEVEAELRVAGAAVLSALKSGEDRFLPMLLGSVYERMLGLEARFMGGRLTLQGAGRGMRWRGGTYFTPPEVVSGLLDVAMEPLLQQRAAHGPDALLDLRICDPSCGAGAFLTAVAERLTERVSAAMPRGRGCAEEAIRMVLGTCIHGVDIDPVAAELCRFALWMLAPSSVRPWEFLEDRIKVGNSLLGATPCMVAACDDHSGDASTRAECNRACALALGDTVSGLDSRRVNSAASVHWHLDFPHVFSSERSEEAHTDTGWRGGFDLVIGNPPFQNRLETPTSADRATAMLLRRRFGGIIRCYADAATAFLVLGSQLVRPWGRLALIQPQSLLAARDAQPARKALSSRNSLEAVWFPQANIFDASVRVCAPVLERIPGAGGGHLAHVRRFGDGFREIAPHSVSMADLSRAATWSPLVADLLGIPSARIKGQRSVGDVAEVTADFRDQYYGLRGAVFEGDFTAPPDCPPLVTTGIVDAAHCAWGERLIRFDRRRWHAPRVDLARLDPELHSWARARLRPKILLATQTRTIEAVVDERGEWLPVTPLISIVPRDDDHDRWLWLIAAALCSPPLAAMAMEQHAGAALSGSAIKLSARQAAALPLPVHREAWEQSADLFRIASTAETPGARLDLLVQAGLASCSAYGLAGGQTSEVLKWWRSRLGPVARQPAPALTASRIA